MFKEMKTGKQNERKELRKKIKGRKRKTYKEKRIKRATMGIIQGRFAGRYSTRNFTHQHKMPKLFSTWSRHSKETGELFRSSVDLIHYDCYTNGINKGKIAILKQNFHPLHLANLIASLLFLHGSRWLWLCVCVCVFVSASLPPPCNGYKVISIFQAWCTMSLDCNILHG